MKKFIVISTCSLLLVSLSAFSQSTVVTQTTTWKSVPIQVDTTKNTYTIVGTAPTDTTDYYYSYSGYRCFKEKRDIAGVNALIFNASVSGGYDIYCYPEQ